MPSLRLPLAWLAMFAALANLLLLVALLLKLKEILMQRHLKVAAAAAVCLVLVGCAGLPIAGGGGASTTDVVGAIKEIASDPRCGHTDRLQGNLGGLGGNNLSLFLERTCPPAPAPNVAPLG